ncbi:MAG: SpoIID/LytB domain-containing protein [Candidatus Tantalella remota]|nr:SpoIID/LytB domain-containing protein [Candidatus Tantalella remota]
MTARRIIKFVLVLVAGAIVLKFFFIPLGNIVHKKHPLVIRVRIAYAFQTLQVSTSSGSDIYDNDTGGLLRRERAIDEGTQVKFSQDSIALGGEEYKVDSLRIVPLKNSGIKVNGTLYRGDLDIVKMDEGLTAINRVELEDYLKGVLPKEVHSLWPFSVLKAQAIASRSYAVYQSYKRAGKMYDLTADTYSQVYGGKSCEKWRTTKAVVSTRGKVLEYEGKILPGYFHACCGGHTESASLAWGKESFFAKDGKGPLKGVKCPWCRWTPYFRWQKRVQTKTILDKLNARGYSLTNVEDVRSGPRDASGRLEYVKVKSRRKWLEISTDDFRSAVGRNVLKSANFRIKKYPFFYLFSGYGWGHGVGMCQWGAFGLGLRRWSDKRILEHYYPGAKIVSLKEILDREGKRN